MKLDIELYDKICKITGIDYEGAKSADENSVLVYHDLDTMLDELVYAYESLQEDYKELEKILEEDYIPKW